MSDAARKLLQEVLNLPENERLELASEIIASVDGPRDAGWESAWLGELDRRVDGAVSKERRLLGVRYASSTAKAAVFDVTFACYGTPISTNPHDDTSATNNDSSIERKPGGVGGNCIDTKDNAADFSVATPSNPQ